MYTALFNSTTHSGNKTRHQDHSKASFSFNPISTRQSSPARLKPAHCSSASFTRLPPDDSTSLRHRQIQPDVVAGSVVKILMNAQIPLRSGQRSVAVFADDTAQSSGGRCDGRRLKLQLVSRDQ